MDHDVKTVAYVLNEFPVLSETFVGNEIRAMTKRGHTIVPIARHRPGATAQVEDMALARSVAYLDETGGAAVASGLLGVHLLPRPRLAAALAFLNGQTVLDRRRLFTDAMKIAALARAAGCTHVHAHFADAATAAAILAARWMGVKVSFVCHGRELYAKPPAVSPDDLVRMLVAADFVISVGADLTNDLLALTPLPLITTIPYATDPSFFTPRSEPQDNGRLLFVGGQLNVHKGLDDLIHALELLLPRRIRLDVVGDGPHRPYLEQLANLRVPGLVTFLGRRPLEWIAAEGPAYLGLVGPFKVAADGSRDSGPVVVKEAMAMGLPVVASRFMGLKETVTSETGFLYEPGNIPQLAAAIRRLADLEPTARHEMGRAARKRVIERFSLDSQAASLSELIETM